MSFGLITPVTGCRGSDRTPRWATEKTRMTWVYATSVTATSHADRPDLPQSCERKNRSADRLRLQRTGTDTERRMGIAAISGQRGRKINAGPQLLKVQSAIAEAVHHGLP